MLPLGAYLLKPVQRITKYQLLLRELERHCRPEVRPEVGAALSAMLDLLAQINAAIHQLHISGFNVSTLPSIYFKFAIFRETSAFLAPWDSNRSVMSIPSAERRSQNWVEPSEDTCSSSTEGFSSVRSGVPPVASPQLWIPNSSSIKCVSRWVITWKRVKKKLLDLVVRFLRRFKDRNKPIWSLGRG